MKKIMILSIIFCLCFYSFAGANDNTKKILDDLTIGKTVEFGGGIIAGLLGHEFGHYVMGEIEGVDVKCEGFRHDTLWLNFDTEDSSKLRNIALAGFGEQIISTEIMLYDGEIDNAFQLGWLSYNILNSISYTLRHELSDGQGDLATIEESGLDSRWVEGVIVTHALISAWRIYRIWKKPNNTGVDLNFSPPR